MCACLHIERQRSRDNTCTDMHNVIVISYSIIHTALVIIVTHTHNFESFLLKNKSDSVQRKLPTCSN